MCANFNRQCDRYGIYKSSGRPECGTNTTGNSSVGNGDRLWSFSSLQSYCGDRQYNSRHIKPTTRSTQLDVTPKPVSYVRCDVGTAHSRSLCNFPKRSVTDIQLQILGANVGRGRCPSTGLVRGEQFYKSAMGSITKNHRESDSGQGSGDHHSSYMAQPAMVSQTGFPTDQRPVLFTSTSKNIYSNGRKSGTDKESNVANCRLEGIWQKCLTDKGWSARAIKQYELTLAPSTLKGYNSMLDKCYKYCDEHSIVFPPDETKHLADFLCSLCDRSERPQSVLATAMAALSHVYCALDLSDITKDVHITRLISALIKSGTTKAMKRSTVLPIEKFTDMFRKWGSNESLSIKQLRLKAITLLALALMLRPSDVAPNAKYFDEDTFSLQRVLFTTDMLRFDDEGVHVTFFGIKNDAQRSGFVVFLPINVDDHVIDPVSCLKCYISKTNDVRSDRAVFLALRSPFKGLASSSIANILEESIEQAGLRGQGFSAKSFRPTGATVAIEKGVNPKVVQQIGRWKSTDVFFQHYVHAKTPSEFTSKVLSS